MSTATSNESLIKGSEPLFIASDKQYSIVAFPDTKTGTGRLNATESDRKRLHRYTFKIPAASHKEAEPQSETRGALANMLRAIFKVKAGAERESYNPLNYSPDDFVSRQKVGAALKKHSANQLDQPVGYSMQSIKRRHLNRRVR